MSRPDWLIAFDDMLTERWRRCYLCGVGHGHMWQGVFEAGKVSVTTMLCASCQRRPAGDILTLLARRTGQG